MSPRVITPGQGLLLLLKHHKDDRNTFQNIAKLYLTGADNKTHDLEICDLLLNSPLLKKYNICLNATAIDSDPTRRYFETHLAYETVQANIHALPNSELIAMSTRMSKWMHPLSFEKYSQTLSDLVEMRTPSSKHIFKETLQFAGYIQRLSTNTIFTQLPNQERKNLENLIFAIYVGLINSWEKTNMPLNIYKTYDQFVNKGKKANHANKTVLGEHHMGLLKSHMPLGCEDNAFSPTAFSHWKSTVYSTFDPESSYTKACFDQWVHPFSNGISGVLLVVMRMLARLHQEDQSNIWVTRSSENFIQFTRLSIASLLYYSGGHSLYEYMQVLNLAEVQNTFECIGDIDQMSLETFFYEGNESAFYRALYKTMDYNDHLFALQHVHAELLSKNGLFKPLIDEILSNSPAAVSDYPHQLN